MFLFDLQLFGGKGGSTTNVQSYEPSEYELQLQKAQADYANAVSPNALWLNNVARNVLQDSLGTVKVDFDSLNRDAQNRINTSMADLYNAYGSNNDEFEAVAKMQRGLYDQVPGITNDYVNSTNGIIRNNTSAVNGTNRTLGDISGKYGETANAANRKLDGLVTRSDNSLDDANSVLTQLLDKSGGTLDKYANVRDSLIRGEIPDPYLQNMQNAISGTMKRTAGEGINSLANRGVINSSVAQGVLDNIEKNATDAVANRYLENINTINNLLGSQTNDALGLLGQQANLVGQRFGNTGNTLDRNLNIYNTQTGNTNNALGQQSSLAQQQLNNTNTANMNNANLYGQQYANRMNSNNSQFDMTNQYMQNALAKNAQNASILNSIIDNSTAPITTAAAAQEAAQAPAANLWNMSLGLNNANTGALAAAAGKGKTTTTTSGGGGGLFSGLLGGLF